MRHLFRFTAANPSLHRQLVLWVLLPQLVLWCAGGVATYRVTGAYVNEAADGILLQASRALARQVKPIGNDLLIDFPRAAREILEADPNDPLLYMVSTPPGSAILGNETIPLPSPAAVPRVDAPYFYDGQIARRGKAPPMHVRIAALYLVYGELEGKPKWMLVQVARNMMGREMLSRRILMDVLVPLSALILLMTSIVWVGTGVGLAPLERLRREVEGRSAADLTPLRIDAAPREVRTLVAALNELLASVRNNVNAQKRFIADAAHQLRTPLAGLASQTALALKANQDPTVGARLTMVNASAARAAHLINQLLSLARADPDAEMVRERGSFDLLNLARDVVADLIPHALDLQADLGMDEDQDEQLLTILGNELLLREALKNVIDNAINYAGAGAVITVRVARSNGHARLIVVDNGPGIPEADLGRVFERFVRATHRGDGCGLGLPIVRQIIEQHGGSVTLSANMPHGLVVTLELPLHGSAHVAAA